MTNISDWLCPPVVNISEHANNAYIAKLHFISKYDNRSVETIHHKAGGAGPGPPISL